MKKTSERSKEEGKRHILIDVQFSEPSWAKWKKRWAEPVSFDERISMLHNIFSSRLDLEELEQAVCFLLEAADGYGEDFPGASEMEKMVHGNKSYFRESIARHRLSQKAFMVLATFFTPEEANGVFPYSKKVFPKLLWFFRRRKPPYLNGNLNGSIQLGKDGGRYYGETARNFAHNFCCTAWNFREHAKYWELEKQREEIANRLDQSWQETLELMERVGQVNFILECPLARERYDQMVELVLSQPLLSDKHGPTSLEEAVRKGSPLAEVLIIARVKYKFDE